MEPLRAAKRESTITPVEVGVVGSSVGLPLGGIVEFSEEGVSLDGYEIQLAGRGGERSKTWQKPIWRYDSVQPRYLAIDGRSAAQGMTVDKRRPHVTLVTDKPIDAYAWSITQDGDLIEEHEEVTDGVSNDGLNIDFRPTRRLRRAGGKGRARTKGVFYPPFDSHLAGMPRAPESRIRYDALTHAGHVNEDAYAVDFNWGIGDDDRGQWVRAAAAGRVREIVRDNGQVHIVHPRFDGKDAYETVYAHMTDIRVKEKEWVRGQQRIGRIGSTFFDPGRTISPHLHHQHRKGGQPIRMKLFIDGKVTPLAVSKKDGSKGRQRELSAIPGWARPRGPAPARLTVRTRDADTGKWSRPNRIRVDIAPRDVELPDAPPAIELAAAAPDTIGIAYDGPRLEPGEYSVRYRARSDAGDETPWAYDHSMVVEQILA